MAADLIDANLSSANLSDADLRYAYLSGATFTEEQISTGGLLEAEMARACYGLAPRIAVA